MVNTNVIISVSAVLVAMLLTIVSLMRQDGDPTDNFSVSVTGTITEEGSTFPADVYFCTGDDCQFYADGKSDQGYFALTGADYGTEVYVSEHSLGMTFVYEKESKNLIDCLTREDRLRKDAFDGKFSALKQSKKLSLDGTVFTTENYVMNADPSTDTPSVVGFGVSTAAACAVAWKAKYAEMDAQPDEDEEGDVEEGDVEEGDELDRKLVAVNELGDPAKVKITAEDLRKLAEFAYSENLGEPYTLPNGEVINDAERLVRAPARNANQNAEISGVCVAEDLCNALVMELTGVPCAEDMGNSAAYRISRKYVGEKGKINHISIYTIAGTDDAVDVMMDLMVHSPDGTPLPFHCGYYMYTASMLPCLLNMLNPAEMEYQYPRPVSFITGHSLGGAAAVIFYQYAVTTAYAPLVKDAKVVTFGAPATSFYTKCSTKGLRLYHFKDPAASNALGTHEDLNHDVTVTAKLWFKWVAACKGWAAKCWRRVISNRYDLKYHKKNNHCERKTTGVCESVHIMNEKNCLYNAQYHLLGVYQLSKLKNINVSVGKYPYHKSWKNRS